MFLSYLVITIIALIFGIIEGALFYLWFSDDPESYGKYKDSGPFLPMLIRYANSLIVGIVGFIINCIVLYLIFL